MPIQEPAHDELTLEEAKRLIAEAGSLGVRIFVFSGGEPLLRPDLFELLDACRSAGMERAVATNGTLLTTEVVAEFRRLGVARVSISLDGASAATHDEFRGIEGSFQKAIEGANLLRQGGQPFQINTTVTRENRANLSSMLSLTQELGACALHLFLLVPVGCGAEIPEEDRITAEEYEETLQWLSDQMKRCSLELRATCAPHLQRVLLQGKVGEAGRGGHGAISRGCLAGCGIVFVGSKGEVQPCGYLPLVVGDIRSESLAAIWSESDVLSNLRDPNLLGGRCGACPFRFRCGGCRARALAASGDVFGEEPMCSWGKEHIDGGRRS